MAIKTWAALASNECVAHAEVADAVTNGDLAWATTNPGLAAGYCYTRSDFETYVLASDMSASGIATNELMSKSEMETYRILNVIRNASSSASDLGLSWQGRAHFDVGNTQSVKVEKSVNGGAYTLVETIDTASGGTGYSTSSMTVGDGQTLDIRLTPYTGDGATGTAGASVVVTPTEP